MVMKSMQKFGSRRHIITQTFPHHDQVASILPRVYNISCHFLFDICNHKSAWPHCMVPAQQSNTCILLLNVQATQETIVQIMFSIE